MTQFGRPDATQAAGLWSPSAFGNIDEDISGGGTGDGSTCISNNNTSPDNLDVSLSNISDPGVATGHVIRVRWNKSAAAGHTINAVCELWEGVPGVGSLRATLTVNDISEVEQESSLTLSAGEAGAITDYTNLYLRLSRQGSTGGAGGTRRSLVVEAVQLETPDAATLVADDDSGSGSDTSTQSGVVGGSDSGTGTETSAVPRGGQVAWAALDIPAAGATPKSGSDTGTGSDVSAATATVPRPDPGAGSDASVVAAVYTVVDSGAGIDAGARTVLFARADSGSGADSVTLSVVHLRSETSTPAEVATQSASVIGIDTGAGADASLQVATYAHADTGSGVDSSTLSTGGVQKPSSDAGTGVESSSLVASLEEIEAGLGVDTSPDLLAHLSRIDAGIGTDAAVQALLFLSQDAGTGADGVVLIALLASADAGAQAESSFAVSVVAGGDAGLGLDSSIRTVEGVVLPSRIHSTIQLVSGEPSTISATRPSASVEVVK